MKIFIFLFTGFLSFIVSAQPDIPDNLQIGMSFKAYNPELFNQVVHHKKLNQAAYESVHFQNSEWKTDVTYSTLPHKTDAVDLEISFICREGKLENASVALDLNISNWSSENYVLVPAALYNGNRYPYRRIRYSPKLMDPRDIGPDKGIIISDVHKLNYSDGPSFVQLRSGAMSTPSVCFYDSAAQKGFIMLTHQATKWGDNGISVTENKNRDEVVISVIAPVVRELYKYRIADSRYPSDDISAKFETGDTVKLRVRLYSFEANQLQDLFNKFAEVRKDLSGEITHNNVLPFSEAFHIQQDKFNRDNWVEEHGYYSVGMRENFLQDWQIGWTGGMISTYPLLFAGNNKTQEHVIRNFDWLFPNGISPSGFFWDSGEHGTKWYGGDIRKPHTANWHLVRKSGDGLFYILQQFLLMEEMEIAVKAAWKTGIKGVADAFVKLWKENGQLGQFVDNKTGEIQVGGSTSGGIVPAALVLAADYFSNPAYLETAEEIGNYFYTNYTQKGLTCGGPGDAMQNFDSESSYALVESYFTLYETTGNKKWLLAAEDAAKQFSTWVMSYNYKFPETSTYGKLGIEAVGAVFANTQNTHGSPGICTHSGLALLKLFRKTGNRFYLDLLNDIVHAIPQCLAHPGQKMPGVKDGWINERINTTDWLEGIGEMMYGSTWAETALMLTAIQIPGLYVIPDKSVFVCFDNLEARIAEDSKDKLVLDIKNPTKMDADLKVFEEKIAMLNQKIGPDFLLHANNVKIPALDSVRLTFFKP